MYDKEVQANRPERGRPEDDTHPQGADAWIPRHTLTTRDRVQTGDGPQGPGGWNPAGAIRRSACLEAHADEQGLAALSELKSSVEKARICVYSDPTIANSYTASKNLIVFSEEDEVFELAIFLTFHSVEYSIDSSGHGAFDEAFGKTDAKAWEFINDSSYPKVGDAEVLFSVIHASRAISDTGVKELFLNAARHLKEAEGVRKMREAAFNIDRKLKSKR